MRKLPRLFAALALSVLAGGAAAGATSASGTDDQQQADDLALQLRSSGQLRDYSIEIEAQGGAVTLTGRVADEAQRRAAIELVRQQPGVLTVTDRLAVSPGLQLISLEQPSALLVNADADERLIEPAPMHTFIGGVAPFADAPVLPPYAWPAYTPYNNFASLAYQTQYPSGAWPFIGPPYPYPMIPSGWRRVTLRWHHGYWWLKFHSH
jgi:hypothetical protein